MDIITSPMPEGLGFKQGFSASFRAVSFLLRRPKHLGLLALPWLINFLVVMPLAFFAVWRWGMAPLRNALPPVDGFWLNLANGALQFAVVLTAAGITLLITLFVGLVIGAPFHDKAGERIEGECFATRPHLIAPPMPFRAGVRSAIVNVLKRLGIGVPFAIMALSLGFLPLIGPLLALAAEVCLTAGFLTLDAFSMPFDRRRIGLRAKMRWLGRNKAFALGFGMPYMIMPCAIAFAPPLSAVAATLIYCEEASEETVIK